VVVVVVVVVLVVGGFFAFALAGPTRITRGSER
jgi:hypothetical protein